jgi:hypothetical protein
MKMNASVMVISGAALLLLLFVLGGGPMLLVDWSRKRRQQEIARQIALTDAIHGRIGPVVSPVVTKPFFGPWEIRLAVPFHHLAAVAKILSVVDEMFPVVEGAGSRPYRIFLTASPDWLEETLGSQTLRWAKGWVGYPVGTA